MYTHRPIKVSVLVCIIKPATPAKMKLIKIAPIESGRPLFNEAVILNAPPATKTPKIAAKSSNKITVVLGSTPENIH